MSVSAHNWVALRLPIAAKFTPSAQRAALLLVVTKAFFYAGSRALMVSHWAIDSQAAVRIATGTFAALKADPAIGRTVALRGAMLDVIGDTTDPWNAYPDKWASPGT